MTAESEISFPLAGEVSDRQERLNGDLLLELDGFVDAGDEEWAVTLNLAWVIGREGEIALSEGDLSVLGEDGDEVNARLQRGAAALDPDTGAAHVQAAFVIDVADSPWASEGDVLTCVVDVNGDEWMGELRI